MYFTKYLMLKLAFSSTEHKSSLKTLSRGAVVIYWQKYVHKVLVNHLEGLSLSRKSVVRFTDCPNMTLDVYCGCKTTTENIDMFSAYWSNNTYWNKVVFANSIP